MGFLSGVVGAVGSVAGSILGGNSAKQNAASANKLTMDLAKNGMQYRVNDLRKAGLNPILAVNGSGGLGSVSSSGIQQAAPYDFSEAANSAVSAYNAETNRKNSLTSKQAQIATEASITNQIANSAADVRLKNAQTDATLENALNTKAQRDLLGQQLLTEASRRANIESSTGLNSANRVRTEYQTIQDKVLADYLNTPTGAESARFNFDNKTGGFPGIINTGSSYLDRLSDSNSAKSVKGVLNKTITIPKVKYSTDVSPYK